jgi:hypothetical protein
VVTLHLLGLLEVGSGDIDTVPVKCKGPNRVSAHVSSLHKNDQRIPQHVISEETVPHTDMPHPVVALKNIEVGVVVAIPSRRDPELARGAIPHSAW